MSKVNIALITGIIGKEMREDPWGTLQAVADIGYQGLEFGSGLVEQAGGSATDTKRRLDDLGLRTFSYGTSLSDLTDDLDRVIEHARTLQCPYVVLFWAPCESRQGVLELAAQFNDIGGRLSEHGLTFCYHNHDHEFRTFDGETGLDILFGNTDAELVKAEIDIAWVRFAGADPAALIRRFGERCRLVHVKDIHSADVRGAWTEVGTGIVDLRGSVEAGVESGVDWFTVEQDQPRDLPPMESIRVSYQNLRRAVEALGLSV